MWLGHTCLRKVRVRMGFVFVKLLGGPSHGEHVKYGTPLPDRIVMARNVKGSLYGLKYADYQRHSNTTFYTWVNPNKERKGHETTS